MNKSEVKSIIQQYGLHPNRKLGQNFLVSDRIRDRIIESSGPLDRGRVLEIGPGLGTLTERLVDTAQSVTAVEIDSGLSRYLSDRFKGRNNFRLLHADFLKSEIEGPFTAIMSNLPYYCSSEMLFRFTRYDVPAAYVMLQKEMAERIGAEPGEKAYGALTISLGFYFEPHILFSVPRQAFYPMPDVTSLFLRLDRRGPSALAPDEIGPFHLIVKSAFWGRRKTIHKALSQSPHLNAGRSDAEVILEKAGIRWNARGEDLSLDDYIRMAKAYGREIRK
jgi:16S rRNA (adenine1518-N6/adenine1519-N6)-dimethyltransferase